MLGNVASKLTSCVEPRYLARNKTPSMRTLGSETPERRKLNVSVLKSLANAVLPQYNIGDSLLEKLCIVWVVCILWERKWVYTKLLSYTHKQNKFIQNSFGVCKWNVCASFLKGMSLCVALFQLWRRFFGECAWHGTVGDNISSRCIFVFGKHSGILETKPPAARYTTPKQFSEYNSVVSLFIIWTTNVSDIFLTVILGYVFKSIYFKHFLFLLQLCRLSWANIGNRILGILQINIWVSIKLWGLLKKQTKAWFS